ncbi:uncharacterized protein DUF2188 [Arthrobacter sp. SLBN-122]|nr:uncharacterized protein DUF2188 [Arthrobacter sp. SLBN-122]
MAQGEIETFWEDSAWKNRREGTNGAFGAGYSIKDEAIVAGREAVQSVTVEHVIKNQDGTISEKNSYGHDPRNIPG